MLSLEAFDPVWCRVSWDRNYSGPDKLSLSFGVYTHRDHFAEVSSDEPADSFYCEQGCPRTMCSGRCYPLVAIDRRRDWSGVPCAPRSCGPNGQFPGDGKSGGGPGGSDFSGCSRALGASCS